MSFLKISDPAKRDFFFQEFQKAKREIKENVLSEKLGKQGQQREFFKEFKPLLEAQSKISTELGAIKVTRQQRLPLSKHCRCGMKICPAWSAVRKTSNINING